MRGRFRVRYPKRKLAGAREPGDAVLREIRIDFDCHVTWSKRKAGRFDVERPFSVARYLNRRRGKRFSIGVKCECCRDRVDVIVEAHQATEVLAGKNQQLGHQEATRLQDGWVTAMAL